MKKLILIYFLLFFSFARAREFRYLQRSPKALLMGDAYTAIADDEYTLFYNPAAMGRHKGLSVYFVNPEVAVTNAIDELDRFENFPSSDPVAIADRVLGLPLYLKVGGMPTLKMSSVGMSMFAGLTTSMVLRNATHPILDLDYRYDRGVAIGYAFTMGSGGKKSGGRRQREYKKRTSGEQLSFGVGLKNVNRQGISQDFDLFGLELLNRIFLSDSSDYHAIRKALGYSIGAGWGVDGGVEYTYSTGLSQFTAGFSILDIGDTRFRKTSGTADLPDQQMSVNSGIAFSQNFGILDYTLSADIHPINAKIDDYRKLHFGANVNIPFLGVMFGWNGGYISYGLSLDIWPISIYAGFYGVEIGGNYLQEEGKRAVFYLGLFDFSFDA